jgi:hypothetical protein
VLWTDFKRAAAVNTNWPLHKLSALDDLRADCIRRGIWREEGNHIRRGPFPPAVPEVAIRELSVDDEGDGYTYLKIEPLHAPAVVFETGNSNPTLSSSPVPTPSRFEATGLHYRFMAYDPNDVGRTSAVKEWTAKLRLKYQVHERGDHKEVELLALPRTNGLVIRYTTDGSSPEYTGAATYDGIFRVPPTCRIVRAMATSTAYGVSSDAITIAIAPVGVVVPLVNLTEPARWTQSTKLDDSSATWDFIRRLEAAPDVAAFDLSVVSENEDGTHVIEFTGARENGYDGAALKAFVDALQDVATGGSLRLSVGAMGFPTGQLLLDWLKATGQPFVAAKVVQ